ncbi:hypothetical protein [Streptomyces sp. T028]|uniref:hypothetical protein n=1 Tax=Streptomyces sp. T028 TaxID=3394379 RepID=UPI003A84E3FD
MNVGTPPEPGTSRLTLRTYRVDRNGWRVGPVLIRVHDGGGDATTLRDSLSWPPCHCFRCMEGEGSAGR